MPLRLGGRLDPASWSPVRVWLAGFLVFFGLAAAWAVATPLTAVPDEPAHMVKAAATARLEFRGTTVTQPTVVDNVLKNEQMGGFSVPAGYRQLLDLHDCYHVDKNTPASCAASIKAESGEAVVGTSAGANNPAYYLLVGWPSLFASGETGLYLMRLLSAAVCSALLASAVLTVVRRRRRSWLMIAGLAAAATPTALFLNGSVNPNSVEVSAAILLWVTALAVFMDPDPGQTNRRLNLAAVASAALVCVRALGPLWIVGILVCAVLAGEPGVLRSLLRKPLVWLWSAVLGALTLGAFAWTAHYGVIITSNVNFPQWTFSKAAAYTFDHTIQYIDSMVGLFGWLDVTPPTQTRLVWYLALLAMTALALAFGRWRERAAVVCLMGAIVLIPVVAMGRQAQHLGMIWQGRYLLAIAAGLPILLTAVLAKGLERGGPVRARLRPAVRPVTLAALGVFAVDGVVMFYGALHRYAVGASGPLFPAHPDWTPPGGLTPAVLLYLASAAGLVALVWGAMRGEPAPAASAAEDPRPVPVPVPVVAGVPETGDDNDDNVVFASLGGTTGRPETVSAARAESTSAAQP